MDRFPSPAPGSAAQREHGGGTAAGEVARYWRHAAVPGVDLLRARYVTHRYARHAHETYTLGLIEDGVEEFGYGGTLLRAGRGAVALLNPEVVHTGHAGVPAGWSYRVLYPAVSVVQAVAADLGPAAACPTSRRPWCTTRTVPGWSGPRTWPRNTVTGWPPRPCCRLRWPGCSGRTPGAAAALPGCPGPGRPVRTAMDLLRARVTDPPPLAELARATGLGPYTLLRAFRAETGLPPHAYLNQVRVRLARGLLDRGVPPAEAAAATGFADQAHLTRHFKRVLGVPPGAYQRSRAEGGRRAEGGLRRLD